MKQISLKSNAPVETPRPGFHVDVLWSIGPEKFWCCGVLLKEQYHQGVPVLCDAVLDL